jgi:predicted transcriptional regulator
MARPTQDVTDAELAVLRALWDQPQRTIRELTDGLYPNDGASGYATVQKLLERLESKGYVVRERGDGPAHRFRASLGRDELIGRRLQAVAESLCDGSLVPLLNHLVQKSRPLSPSDRRTLFNLIERLEHERGKS